MALPSSGPLSWEMIRAEFGGGYPISLSQYYAGGGLVPPGTSGTYGPVPTSGALNAYNFYGTSNISVSISPPSQGGSGTGTSWVFSSCTLNYTGPAPSAYAWGITDISGGTWSFTGATNTQFATPQITGGVPIGTTRTATLYCNVTILGNVYQATAPLSYERTL